MMCTLHVVYDHQTCNGFSRSDWASECRDPLSTNTYCGRAIAMTSSTGRYHDSDES